MSRPAPRGACPGVFEPMATGDGLLVRVKPPVDGLDADDLALLAEAAARHGNGATDLTARGSLQVRGLAPATVDAFAAAMGRRGLVAASAGAERVRNLLVAPLAGDDPAADPAAVPVAEAIRRQLAERPTLLALPAKFGFAVDAGGRLPLGPVSADVRLWPVAGGWAVAPAGAALAAVVSAGDAAAAAVALADAFLRLAPAARRMAHAVAAAGEAALWRDAGLVAGPVAAPALPGPAVGQVSYGDGRGAVGCAAAFGALDADVLARLAGLMRRFAVPRLRVGPWRSLHLLSLAAGALPHATREAEGLGLIVEPEDPRLAVAACAGAPGCASALVPTRDVAEAVARRLAAGAAPVHVSGCAKGCARARPAATLVGEPGGTFAFVRRGRAHDEPVRRGLSADDAVLLATGARP